MKIIQVVKIMTVRLMICCMCDRCVMDDVDNNLSYSKSLYLFF